MQCADLGFLPLSKGGMAHLLLHVVIVRVSKLLLDKNFRITFCVEGYHREMPERHAINCIVGRNKVKLRSSNIHPAVDLLGWLPSAAFSLSPQMLLPLIIKKPRHIYEPGR